MPPKSSVRALRIHVPHERDGVTTVRGIGFRFTCTCGAKGPRRYTYASARVDLREHRTEHARPGALEVVSPARGTEAS